MTEQIIPLSARISQILWEWRFSDPALRPELLQRKQLALLLARWFPYREIEFTCRQNLWCDGIVHLELSDISRTAFLIAGVGYFPHQLSPFEFEFHFSRRRERSPTSIQIRLGILDGRENLQTFPSGKSAEFVMSRRPQTLQEWAVAVELQPDG